MTTAQVRRRAWLGAAGIAAVAVTGTLACSRSKAETPAAPEPVVVGLENLLVVRDTLLADGPAVSGTLVAEREARVRAELGGSVVRTLVEPGDPVRAGQVLAEIDPTTAQDAVLAARAQVRSAEMALDLARRNAERDARLLAAGAVSERAAEDSRRTVASAEAAVADATARLTSAQQTLSRATVRAPFAGIVSERQASAGDIVSNGTALVTVVDPSSLRLDASVPAEAIGSLRVGTPVAFTLSGVEGRALRGTISRIAPVVDPATRQVKLAVTIPNPGQRLVAGLFAEGRVVTTSREGIAVSRSALDMSGVRPVVTRLKGGRAERVEVALGLEDASAERVEVTAGLQPGDTVLVGAARGIAAGTVVRVTAAAERAAADSGR